jgi:hypothetical protein
MLMKEKNEGEKVIFKKSFAESKKKTLGEEILRSSPRVFFWLSVKKFSTESFILR